MKAAQLYHVLYPATQLSLVVGRNPSFNFTYFPLPDFPTPSSNLLHRAHSYRTNVCFFKKQLRVYLGMGDREYEKNFLYFPFSHRVHKSYSSLKDRMYPEKN